MSLSLSGLPDLPTPVVGVVVGVVGLSTALSAVALGSAGGMSPGLLHSMILSVSLRHGAAAGMKLGFVPVISDAPSVLAGLLFATALPEPALRAMAVLGGVLLIGIGVASAREGADESSDAAPLSFTRACVVNVLNPNPWIFWLGAGAPLLSRAFDLTDEAGPDVLGGVIWLTVFYVGVVGVKLVFAAIVGTTGHRLSPRLLRWSLLLAAGLMVAVGVWLVALGVLNRL